MSRWRHGPAGQQGLITYNDHCSGRSTRGLDDAERLFPAKITDHGWFWTEVLPDDEGSGFSYTTDFCISAKHPDFIIFGLNGDIASHVLCDIYRDAQAGHRLPTSVLTDEAFGNSPLCFPGRQEVSR